MKTLRLVVVLALALPAVSFGDEQIKSAFGPGEYSRFVVSFFGVPTGEFNMTVGMLMRRDNHDVWPILCNAKTDIPVYTINDKYVAYWDPVNQVHTGSDFWIDENKKKRREHVTMRREEKKALVKRANVGEPLHDTTYDVPDDALDVASATFWLRNIPLRVGDQYSRNVFTGAVQFKMTAKVLEKTKIQTKFGEKDVYKVEVGTEFAGQLAQKRNVVAYLTADKLQAVIRVEAEFLLGQITADLVEFEAGRDFSHQG